MIDLDLLLWTKVREDDREAFEILFRKHYVTLCFLSKRFTNDMTTSREVVQDIFIYLWEHRYDLEINTSFKSYLTTSVKYNSIRRIKNDSRAGIRMDVLPDNNTEFNDHLEYAELQASILKAIESLPDHCRQVFIMSRFDQLKYSEIAQQLRISVKTVEAHISKALRILREHLDKTIIILTVIHMSGLS